MIAATHFDPEVGVDIHIILIPPAAVPTPIPHPFVGMVIDPMEYAPFIGGTVKVNGVMRGVAGTGGKCLPPHIPIGGPFAKPPGNESEIFMGSQTVVFDGDPASRLGLPVLSCHDIGMPPIPRKKPHTKSKSMELPTTVVLAVPKGPPVLIGGPPTISMMAMAMKFGMAMLGKMLKKFRAMQKGSKRWAAASDWLRKKANALLDKVPGGNRMKNMVSNAICSVTGHPVDVASGKVFTDAVDVELPGPLPFRFGRVWYSCSEYAGPLGRGWHHTYDLGLYPFDEVVAVRLADGRVVAFDPPAVGEATFNRAEKLFLRRDARGYDVETLDGLVYHFGWLGKPGEERPLEHVRDPNGNRIELVREKGRLVAFVDSGGRRLPVTTDAEGRITEVRVPDPDRPGETYPMASYHYSRGGHLAEVRDALGHPFRYYYGNHLLLKETDRSGLSFYFMYDGDGPGARCVRTWGDGNVFLRDLKYDDARRRTEVTNSLGHTTVYEWNPLGVVTAETDPLGGVTKTAWSPFGDRLAVTNPNGETTAFAYDDFGRLVSVTDPTGAAVGYEYDAAGNQVAFTDPVGATWRREYDARRNVVAVTDPLGHRQTYQVDTRGLLVRGTDPLGRSTEFTWTAAGLVASQTDRTGARTAFGYDGLGRRTDRTDPVGGVDRVTYDRRGLITSATDRGGRRVAWRYDPAGNIVERTDPLGRRSTYTYGVLGRVTGIRRPSGRVTRYRYDAEARLVEAVDPAGGTWRYVRDPLGRVVEERTSDGRRLARGYDKSGRQVEAVNARGQRVVLTRDRAGRLASRVLPDGSTETFGYDPRGLMVSAGGPGARVRRTYDPCGRLLAEAINGRTTTSTYDPGGRRVARVSPLGRRVDLEYDPEGRLVAAAAEGRPLFRSDLDPLGRERRRVTPGGTSWEWEYLPTGELGRVRVRGRAAFERSYAYDPAGTPAGQADSLFGPTEYAHDADGFLTAAGAVAIARDPAGAVAPPRGVVVRRDPDGNVVEKAGPGGRWQFDYDPLGRLTRAAADGGPDLAFGYDPLGRRVRRAAAGGDPVDCLWDHNLALGEAAADPVEYLHRPGSFHPVARFGTDGAALIECDPVGLPRSAVDTAGELVWAAAFEPFGAVREERGRPGAVRVRYPGQTADPDTGLLYNRFRDLDPEVGAYLTPDPLGLLGGGGVWDYVPSPLSWVDPYGLSGCPAAHAAEIQPGKYARKGEAMTFEDAVAHVRGGGDVIAKDKHTARAIAEAAGDGFPVHDLPHGKGQMPHYHPTSGGERVGGHVLY